MEALENILEHLEQYFNAHSECTEHALIHHLRAQHVEPFNQFNLRQSKELFCAHFLIMHALYQLQDRYHASRSYCLLISSIRIQRAPYFSGAPDVVEHDTLKAYYLDLSHYFETSEAQVNELLDGFWRKYLAQDDKLQALAVLGLGVEADYPTIKKRYQTLAQKTHPDKGGCAQQFVKIIAAKKLLDTLYR